MEMDRWQIFFDNSGEDLWTIIDWALTIAAVNYPQELRIRRDGFAEKLFGPPQLPPVSSNCEGPTLTGSTEVRNAAVPRANRDHFDRDDHAQVTACSYGDGVTEEHDEETVMRQEIFVIRERLEDCSEKSVEEEFLEPLDRLEKMNISVKALKATEIGKVVNNLRKHGSKRVAAAAKRLVRTWKDMVDEWVKIADETEANEIAAPITPASGTTPDDRRIVKPACSDASQMLDIVDDDARPTNKGAILRPGNYSDRRTSSTNASRLPDKTQSEAKRVPSSTNARKQCRPPECGSMTEKLEAAKLEVAKRRMHEGYRQVATAKKQRTVQVVGLEEVPQLNGRKR